MSGLVEYIVQGAGFGVKVSLRMGITRAHDLYSGTWGATGVGDGVHTF